MARPIVALALRQLRLSLGCTQDEFARRLKVQLPTVGKWETSHPPAGHRLKKLLLLARAHRHPATEVFRRALEEERLMKVREGPGC